MEKNLIQFSDSDTCVVDEHICQDRDVFCTFAVEMQGVS